MLNEEQIRAIKHGGKPLCIFAGPGTGKTLILQKKYEEIIKAGINPTNIIGLTFTTSAANELIMRISRSTGLNLRSIQVATFHSMCYKLIQRHPTLCDLKHGFTLLSPEMQEKEIFTIIQEMGITSNNKYVKSIREIIAKAKRRQTWGDKKLSYAERLAQDVYTVYQHYLKKDNMIDFEDMIVKANKLIQAHPSIQKECQERYKYILVDEAQDMDKNQYEILKAIGGENTTIVGDDDQSIYGFAGSSPEFIQQFITDLNADIITMNQSYRSTEKIINSSQEVIRNNTNRKEKDMKPNSKGGENIKIIRSEDERQEAENIARITEEIENVAIIYRQNRQSKPIEKVFQERGIPYKTVDNTGFYQRKEIKDAVAIINLTTKNTEESIRRVLSIQPNIGKATIQKVIKHAEGNRISYTDACLSRITGITKEQHETLVHIGRTYRNKDNQIPDLIRAIMPKSNPHSEERIDTFINSLEKWEGDIESYIDQIQNLEKDKRTVKMLTLHRSKGLEFGTIIIAGFEQGIIPYFNSIYEEKNSTIEEERRLAYVGITRAKKSVFLSFAKNRQLENGNAQQIVSQFIDEIPQEHKEYI